VQISAGCIGTVFWENPSVTICTHRVHNPYTGGGRIRSERSRFALYDEPSESTKQSSSFPSNRCLGFDTDWRFRSIQSKKISRQKFCKMNFAYLPVLKCIPRSCDVSKIRTITYRRLGCFYFFRNVLENKNA